ncbi:unnamed protein product [Oikopleura dioica]|uniref:Polysaccharide biosynthesis domain-containing protein n=1 Tax=Oikopleura dioica TaxID=34765 RepID=E4XK25_OIKDI|nr:unnamed protein product [Oikopleura dioica]
MSFNLDGLGDPNAMMAGAAALGQDASSYDNTSDVEANWAARAFQQAEIHMKLLLAVGPARMKFSPMDEELYQSFRKEFPDFDVVKIDEDAMKSKEGKEQWRNWVNQFKDSLKDFNFGSLLRTDPTQDYSAENTIFCLRAQFLAIEIARNREGHNQKIVDDSKKAAAGASGGCCSKC